MRAGGGDGADRLSTRLTSLALACRLQPCRGQGAFMSKLPECIQRADRARLFPILAETSKEGRTLSIFLATLSAVRELSTRFLGEVRQRVGTTAKVRTFTEIEFKCAPRETNLGRPDGLIVLDIGTRRWTALVEAKVGRSEITVEQLERYLTLAKQNKIDAVITISNQFSAVPHHHPVRMNMSRFRGVELFHFPWMHILTEADLLTINRDIRDDDQAYILKEFLRFISHESAGVQGFTQMPEAWPSLLTTIKAAGPLQKSNDVGKVAEAWQQEARDLCLVLSRQLKCLVSERLSRAALADPETRFQSDAESIVRDQTLAVSYDIPGAAAPLDVKIDLRGRSVLVAMRLRAPDDRVNNKARLNWLLRQLPEVENADLHIRCHWPKTSAPTQFKLAALRADPGQMEVGKGKMKVIGFDVILASDLGRRFDQRRNFIDELEKAVPEFYLEVGQHLKAWQAPPPKISEGREEASMVTPSAISETAEAESMQE